MLPGAQTVRYMQAAMLARGRKVRQSRLLFYAKMAEKSLQTYERDGWGEFPTQINLDRREVRCWLRCSMQHAAQMLSCHLWLRPVPQALVAVGSYSRTSTTSGKQHISLPVL